MSSSQLTNSYFSGRSTTNQYNQATRNEAHVVSIDFGTQVEFLEVQRGMHVWVNDVGEHHAEWAWGQLYQDGRRLSANPKESE